MFGLIFDSSVISGLTFNSSVIFGLTFTSSVIFGLTFNCSVNLGLTLKVSVIFDFTSTYSGCLVIIMRFVVVGKAGDSFRNLRKDDQLQRRRVFLDRAPFPG